MPPLGLRHTSSVAPDGKKPLASRISRHASSGNLMSALCQGEGNSGLIGVCERAWRKCALLVSLVEDASVFAKEISKFMPVLGDVAYAYHRCWIGTHHEARVGKAVLRRKQGEFLIRNEQVVR